MFGMLDEGAQAAPGKFDAAVWNAPPARLVQGLLHLCASKRRT